MSECPTESKSCLNCCHVHVDRDPGSYWQPPSEEIYCKKVDGLWNQIEDYACGEDEFPQYCAINCQHYEYKAPDQEPPDDFPSPKQEREIDRIEREWRESRMKAQGLLDEEGNPTEKLYEQVVTTGYEISKGK